MDRKRAIDWLDNRAALGSFAEEGEPAVEGEGITARFISFGYGKRACLPYGEMPTITLKFETVLNFDAGLNSETGPNFENGGEVLRKTFTFGANEELLAFFGARRVNSSFEVNRFLRRQLGHTFTLTCRRTRSGYLRLEEARLSGRPDLRLLTAAGTA